MRASSKRTSDLTAEIKINGRQYDSMLVVKSLDQAKDAEQVSYLVWKRLKGKHAAISCLVSGLLRSMNDTIQDWLPSAVSQKSNNTVLEVTFKLFLSDIDTVLAEQEFLDLQIKQQAVQELAEMLDETDEFSSG